MPDENKEKKNPLPKPGDPEYREEIGSDRRTERPPSEDKGATEK
jgi:hypothetical protein